MSGAHGVADVRDDGRDSPASTEQLTKCGEKEPSEMACVAVGSRLRTSMGTRPTAKFWPQLWATVVRNLLLKKRDTRKTLAEVLVPLYSLGVLIFLKMLIPNPNFPEVREPGPVVTINHNTFLENHSVAVVADWFNANGTMSFLDKINTMLEKTHQRPIRWIKYNNTTEMNDAYHNDARNFPISVIFHTDPTSSNEPLRYTIRTNPSHVGTPSTRTFITSATKCRESKAFKQQAFDWTRGGQLIPISEMHGEDTCPVLQYYYSGFLALQTIIDYIKIKVDTNTAIPPPHIELMQFPKHPHTGDWLVIFRVIMPMYMVMTLSQFITYLLMFVVGEKEKKIREGMRIMGLVDSVYWVSWFLIYAVFVTLLSIVSTVLLFTLKVFQHSSYILIFLLMLLFGFTIITFAFMLTPFFDKARTAGILGSFAVNLMSALYFIQVFVSDADSLAFWFVSLISSSCYALAMDKALILDMAGDGVTWDNLWNGPGVPFGGSLIMMAIDTVLYGLIAYWLDAVMPSEYGIKQKPWFCLMPSFWIGSRRGRVSAVHFQSNGDAAHHKDIEPVPRELQEKEAIRIVGLQKTFRHCRRPEIKAIDGIDLSIYEGQITAVLGHNGAGKSTLFNILTGLTAPTAGTAYVYGLDVRDPNDMYEIRQMIGVCPQQDVLFELLSVKEHLEFFAAVKGIPKSRIKEAIHKALSEVGVLDQSDVFAKHLSGGQKRKLSIAIALIGDPRIIILDEPTAGVDPVSRRQTWRILQRTRHGKVLLLTTHFMDEADILGDRKAVISKGKVRCAGTSLFLKNKFGIGYHLTLVLDGVCRENQITRLVRGHVPRAEKARRHGRELSYILPHYAVHLFPPLFNAIEHEIKEKTNRLGITSYGVSMTTLEEVFLSLEGENAEETEEVEGPSSVKLVRARALSRSLSLQSKTLSYQELNDKDSQKTTSLPTPPASHALHSTTHGVEHVKVAPEGPISVDVLGETVKTNPTFWRTFCAVVYIRTIRMIRDPYKLYVTILMPIVSCALGLYMKSRQLVLFRMQPLKLDPSVYSNKTPIAVLTESNNIGALADMQDSLETLGSFPIVNFDGNFSDFLNMENFGAIWLRASTDSSISSYQHVLTLYNSSYTHSLPIIMNLLDNSLYRVIMSMSGLLDNFKPIEVLTHPFQQTEQQEEFNMGNVICAVFMGMIFAIVPVTLAVDIVYDREIKAKNQLRVNGLSMSMYFLTYFIVLICIMMITSIGVLVLVYLNDIPSFTNSSAITMLSGLLLLYSPSAILFNTCLSYVFDKMDSAQSIMPNITTWVGIVPFLMVVVIDTFKWGSDIAFYLHLVFSFLNVMYIPYAIIYYIDRVYITCNLRGLCTTPELSSYFTTEVWVLVVAMLIHIPICGAAVLAADRLKTSGRICPRKRSTSDNAVDTETEAGGEASEDDDVRKEQRRVANILNLPKSNAPPLVVHNLRKEYKVRGTGDGGVCWSRQEAPVRPRFVGLARLSLAVEGGEVFGLLGHNGAGKTTAMRIITAEVPPTHGTVMLGSQNIQDSQSSAFQMLGYCPQHDALWKNVTIREHIECYAAIRGVSKQDTPRIVDAYLNGLQIMEHSGKNAETCSGGTRRKLSFALAMVGCPRVVLLDEPSTGMDPRSKRFLWDTILATFQGKKGAILTTHSMEEADALCSRVGIMVKGGLRCIGSTQHLKNLYGAGYTLEMKIGQSNQKSTMIESELSMSPSPLRSNENSPSLGEADEGGSAAESVGTEGEVEGETEAVDASIHTPLVAGTPPSARHKHHRTESGGGGANAEAAIALVAQLFPSAILEENFADRLVFSVPQSGVSSLARCFQQIEDAKEKLNIIEYSFSQTTLEQVFLKFAQSETVDPDKEH